MGWSASSQDETAMADRRPDGDLVLIVAIVLGVFVVVPAMMMAAAMPMMGGTGWWGDGTMGGVSPVWGVATLLVLLVVVAAIGYLLYRALAGRGGADGRADPAIEELRLAYARGDLTEEEFEERRERLRREE